MSADVSETKTSKDTSTLIYSVSVGHGDVASCMTHLSQSPNGVIFSSFNGAAELEEGDTGLNDT